MDKKKTVIFDDSEWFESIDVEALFKELDEEEAAKKAAGEKNE